MKRYGRTGLIIVAICACALLFIRFFPNTLAGTEAGIALPAPLEKPAPATVADEQPPAAPPSENVPGQAVRGEAEDDEDLNRQVIVARLSELFGARIGHPGVQLQAIERLIRYLKEIYPENWQDHVFDLLTLAFPDQAQTMYDNYLKLMDYKQWVTGNYNLLIGLKATERKNYLWDMRRAFFGDDTDRIWEMEIRADKLSRSLEQIDETQLPFAEKVDYYRVSLDGIYGDQAEAYRRAYRQNIIDKFLALESVQAELRRMNAEARHEHLADLRTAMGMDQAALNRWSALDTLRDHRWENGRAYMQARTQVLDRFSGKDREQRLEQLRRDFFGDEADIIRNEEQSGLFRFSGQRVYGKN